MASPPHTRSGVAHSTPTGGSVTGSIALLALLVVGVVAASYPQMALATGVGAVGTHLVLEGIGALRMQLSGRRPDSLTARVTPGSDQGTANGRTKPGRSVPGRRS